MKSIKTLSKRASRNSRLAIPKPRNSAQLTAQKRTSKILTVDPASGDDDDSIRSATIVAATPSNITPHYTPHSPSKQTPNFTKPITTTRRSNPRSSASVRFNFKR